MAESWLACPYCDLSFFNEEQYKKHFQAEHKGRKMREAATIRSQDTELE
jgi:uncharacterized C2H2 Zn-finger protein